MDGAMGRRSVLRLATGTAGVGTLAALAGCSGGTAGTLNIGAVGTDAVVEGFDRLAVTVRRIRLTADSESFFLDDEDTEAVLTDGRLTRLFRTADTPRAYTGLALELVDIEARRDGASVEVRAPEPGSGAVTGLLPATLDFEVRTGVTTLVTLAIGVEDGVLRVADGTSVEYLTGTADS